MDVRLVAESSLLLIAEFVGNGIEGVHASNVGLRVLDSLAVLDVEAANFAKGTGARVVRSDEPMRLKVPCQVGNGGINKVLTY